MVEAGAGAPARWARARLLAAAFPVFAVNGCRRVSMAKICTEAGVSRGAFYSNFESVDKLFLALYEERAAELRHRVATVLPRARRAASGPRGRSLLVERLSRVTLSEPDGLLSSFESDVRTYAAVGLRWREFTAPRAGS
ncbi:TetR/AcrR family transcriptional regulator [Streptomyces achromogenes]|uniref:TetR/AcrR family transcriptional regulator n=1 Tax=Streptomyces achromogenes TaxID=67255 RepID=UPI0033D08F48